MVGLSARVTWFGLPLWSEVKKFGTGSAGVSEGEYNNCPKNANHALMLGVFSNNDGRHDGAKLTQTANKYNNMLCNRLMELLSYAGPCPKLGETRIFYNLEEQFGAVCVVGLGKECAGYDDLEHVDEGKENIRVAAGAAVRALSLLKPSKLSCESFGHAESCAEGAALSAWTYQEFKSSPNKLNVPTLDLFDDCNWTGWQIGLQKAAAQNLARQLMETPSNFMTPIMFAQTSVEVLCRAGINVEVKVRDWAELQGMGGFLAVGKGSCYEPVFMELSYFGTGEIKERPIVLVGKGVTFDSGGLGLGHRDEISNMRGDVAGAACVVAAMRAVASLQLPINIRGLIPLCEHMPGCGAMKPGDVAVTYSGRSVLVQDPHYEGRLMLADALSYGQTFWPRFILDVGSMTKGIHSGFSTACAGVFSNSDKLWDMLRLASIHTGDRVWRMPLFNHYNTTMQSTAFDSRNFGQWSFGANPCRCAAFLREFVPCGEWMHIDNFGVTMSDGKTDPVYLRRGMTGRPTRTLVEFLSQLTCTKED